MTDLLEFFHMGGYGFYVWTSYGSTTMLLAGIVLWTHRQHERTRVQTFRRALQSGRKQ